jgi:hypothetical protein
MTTTNYTEEAIAFEATHSRSGSEKRQRSHIERFRTDDAEHAALHLQRKASGLSLGAFVMRLAGIESSELARGRRRPRVEVDAAAILRALVAFHRASNHLAQIARTANRLVLEARNPTDTQLVVELHEIRRSVDDLRADFTAPLAAITEALNQERGRKL